MDEASIPIKKITHGCFHRLWGIAFKIVRTLLKYVLEQNNQLYMKQVFQLTKLHTIAFKDYEALHSGQCGQYWRMYESTIINHGWSSRKVMILQLCFPLITADI